MTTYKYLNDSVVAKIDDDGLSRMSCTIENPELVAWLSEGNTPEPADLPSANELILQQIVALEATQTPRRIREGGATVAGATWLADLEAQIAALRVGLK
jgi:hypothetical protein